MSKIYYRANEFYDKIKHLREEGVSGGLNVGFHTLNELYTRKLGWTTYLYSAPFSGKTSFEFEVDLNLSVKYGWIHAIFSPETGAREDIVAELVFKMTGKELYSTHRNAVDDETLKQALGFIQDHFIFIDPDIPEQGNAFERSMLTHTAFYQAVREAEEHYDIKIHSTVIDPFNELQHNMSDDGNMRDIYTERMLGITRKDAMVYNRHNVILTHVVNQPPKTLGAVKYYEPATAREIAGGQAWFRKGAMMISGWRPPVGLPAEDGRLYVDNEFHVIVQKAKPRYCGRRGTAILFYDEAIGRYYEVIDGKKYYAFEYDNYAYKMNKEGKLLIS